MRGSSAAGLIAAVLLVSPLMPACDGGGSDTSSDDDGGKKRRKKKKKRKTADTPSSGATATGGPAAPSAGPKVDASGWKFVRERPADKLGVDACTYLGGFGFACLDALTKETDATKKAYMRLLSDADARIAHDHLVKGEAMGVAHAEVSMSCADAGACKAKGPDGSEMDDGYACLTKAEIAHQEGDKTAATAAHRRACECDPVRAQIPVMGGMLACDGPKKPVSRGEVLSSERAKNVRDCATCEPTRGPAACASEIGVLRSSGSPIAAYLLDTHVPRCQSK